MLYLYTGTPGSSKTLNAIKMICEDALFKDRPVFYYNIKEVTHPWTELSDDEVKHWFDLPAGSVVFIDECQKVFRPRAKSAAVPKYVEELETHRHLGIDLVVCTQGTELVDSNLLAQVEMHRHLERRYGKEEANQFQWEKACKTVDAKARRAQAVVTTIKFDKKYYGTYKSADAHTRKPTVPLKLRLIQAFIALTFIAFVVYAIKIFLSIRQGDEVSPPADVEQFRSPAAGPLNFVQPSEPDPFRDSIPRIEGLAWTAPKYDEVNEVRSAPKPKACFYFKARDICKCGTQQGTHMSVPKAVCMDIVARGFFDPSIPDGDVEKSDDRDTSKKEQQLASSELVVGKPRRVHLEDNSYWSRPR